MLLFVAGVFFEVVATLLRVVGNQLVTHSARLKDERRAWRTKVAGLAITTVLVPMADATAYALAPQSMVAPLNGLDIVWNSCSAPYTLGERLTMRHVMGTTLVFGGAFSAALLGPHREEAVTLQALRDFYFSARFAAYAMAFACGLAASATVLRMRPKGVKSHARGIALGTTAGAIVGNMYFTAHALGLLRASMESREWSAWTHWLPYAVTAMAVATALANVPLMTRGLEEYEALFMVPIFEGSHICVACISGQILRSEMSGAPAWRLTAYWLSISTIVVGLLVVQSTAAQNVEEPKKVEELEVPPEANLREVGSTRSPRGSRQTPNGKTPGARDKE